MEAELVSQGEIKEGCLKCPSCKDIYPVRNYIPRFVSSENYAASFGYEWHRHARSQIDKFNGTTISQERFFKVTGWTNRMTGQLIMEAGCGAGRFTQVALETGAQVFSFDYSSAVDVNLENNGLASNLHLFQADIYSIPLKANLFDKIFCFGVLQHTPDVKKAFLSLLPYLKNGGEVVVDIYSRRWFTYLKPKYFLRPLAHLVEPPTLYRLVARVVPILLPLSIFLRKIPVIGKYLSYLVPVANYKDIYPLTKQQLVEWSILDTFDGLSPRFDKPQRIDDIRGWLLEAGLTGVEVKYGPNGINAKGIKPGETDSP